MSFAPWNPEPDVHTRPRMRQAPRQQAPRQQAPSKPYIVYFSWKCTHSKNFLLTVKRKNAVKHFSFFNIDKVPVNQIPPYISRVPSVVFVQEKKMLEGMAALEWIGFEEKKQRRTMGNDNDKNDNRDEGDRSGNHSRQANTRHIKRNDRNSGGNGNGNGEDFLPGFSGEDEGFSDMYTELIGNNDDGSIDYQRGTASTSDDLFYTNQPRIASSAFSSIDAVDNFRIYAPDEGEINPNDIDNVMERMERERDLEEKMRAMRN